MAAATPKPEPGLRARKLAQAKSALLEALVERLRTRPFETIPVKELCMAVGISEPTFFNYFPRKTDVFVYFIQIWSLQAAWHARQALLEHGPRAALWAVFEFTGRQMAEQPAVSAEVMAFQARLPREIHARQLTAAERRLALPNVEDVDDLPAVGLDGILPPLIRAAIRANELPRGTDVAGTMLAFATVFFGVPVTLLSSAPEGLLAAYRRQFDLVWSAIALGPARLRGKGKAP